MAKAGFYAVAKGRVPGIYASWDDCEAQVKGYIGAKYKKFRTQREAEVFVGVSTSTLITSGNNAPLSVLRKMNGAQEAQNSSTLKPDVSTNASVSEEGYDVVYADGACKGNGQTGSVAGVGVWWGHNDPRNIAERCPGAQTNNRAELIAIVRVLEKSPPYGRPLMIKTDSNYSIKCIQEWHQNWAHQDWKTSSGKPVLNAELIRYILSLLILRQLEGRHVKFVHVKGHAGIVGNEGADAQANMGTLLPEIAERDWNAERARVEELIDELREGPEVVDKAVQFESVEEDEEKTKEKETGEMDVGATDTQLISHDTSVSVSVTVVGASTKDEPEAATQDASSQTSITIDGVEYSIDDLMSQEELDAEVAEALKS